MIMVGGLVQDHVRVALHISRRFSTQDPFHRHSGAVPGHWQSFVALCCGPRSHLVAYGCLICCRSLLLPERVGARACTQTTNRPGGEAKVQPHGRGW